LNARLSYLTRAIDQGIGLEFDGIPVETTRIDLGLKQEKDTRIYLKKTLRNSLASYHYFSILGNKCKDFLIEHIYTHIEKSDHIALNYHKIVENMSESKSQEIHCICFTYNIFLEFMPEFKVMSDNDKTAYMVKFYNRSEINEFKMNQTIGYDNCLGSEDNIFTGVTSRIYDLCKIDSGYLVKFLKGGEHNEPVLVYKRSDADSYIEEKSKNVTHGGCMKCGHTKFLELPGIYICANCEQYKIVD
jgi:hypothetical protein